MMQQETINPAPGSADRFRLPRRARWALLALAAAVRLLYLAEHRSSPFFAAPSLDERYYDGMARALIGGGDLGRYGGFRPMLYPLFLAAPYGAAGVEGGRVLAVVLQHALGIATVLLVALGGARLARDTRAGWAAGALYALAGPPLYFEGELLIASLMAFLCAGALCAIFRAADERDGSAARRWALAGAWIGLAAQARPNVLPVLAAFPLLALWRGIRRRPRWGAPLAALGGAFGVLLLFAPVNRLQSGRFQLVTGAGGINFYVGNHRRADGMIPRQPAGVVSETDYLDSLQVFADREYRRRMQEQGRTPSDDPAAVSGFWTAETLREIRAEPGRWIALLVRKTRMLLWNHEAPNNKSYSFVLARESRLLRALPVAWFVLLALLPAGLWHAARRKGGEPAAGLALFLVFYGAGIVLFFVNGRFRIPLWPGLAMAGGGGVMLLAESVRERAWARAAIGGGAALLLGILSLRPVAGAPPDDHARDLFFRANARLEQGDAGGAVADARESLALDPAGNPDARLTLGNALFGIGDFAGAVAAYEDFVARDPGEPRGWNNLGAARAALGDWPAAYAAYRWTLDLRPGHRSALLNTAYIELRAGRADLAAPRIETVAQAGIADIPLLCALAALAERRGDAALAMALIDDARSRDAAAAGRALAELAAPVSIPALERADSEPPGSGRPVLLPNNGAAPP